MDITGYVIYIIGYVIYITGYVIYIGGRPESPSSRSKALDPSRSKALEFKQNGDDRLVIHIRYGLTD